jgi:dihydroxycyclohexadiene carboxylate dehydrogenase
VNEALVRFDRVDILVNNVDGTIWAKPYAEYEEAQIEAEIRRSLFPMYRARFFGHKVEFKRRR